MRLINKTDQYVAFKVKTTSPKKYCVRPNVGVIEPKATHEFVVIMQAPKTAPVDMTCKDKFLIQNTTVAEGTGEEDLTSEMFSKDSGRHVEESKLRVFLVTPSLSPEMSPINGTPKQVDEHMDSKTVSNEDLKPVNSAEVEPIQDVKIKPIKNVTFEPMKVVDSSVAKDVESELTKAIEPITRKNDEAKVIEPRMSMGEEDKKLFKDVEEMKSKLHELESKLSKAEVTISKLTEERRLAIQDRESLQQEMAFLRRRKVERRVQDGFPLLFVCMVALISLVVGYGFHP